MGIRAVVFDLDDTLYEEKTYVNSGFLAVDGWVRQRYGISGFYEEACRLFSSNDRTTIFNRALEQLGIHYDTGVIKQLVQCYRGHLPAIQLFEDASKVLEQLDGSVKLGLISDGYLEAQQQKVTALNLERIFSSILLTDSLGREYWKPSPVPYELTSRRLGVEGSECLYIGDNVKKDFITANKLGWTTIQVARGDGVYSGLTVEREYHAHYQITSLSELSRVDAVQHLFERGGSYVC